MPSLNHIHLIAPSYPLTEQAIELTKSYFENLGMRITVPPNLLGEDLLCANKDEIRLAHLKHALNDSSADVIWLLQGGYGLTRLIHKLLPMEKPRREKLFIGCSDGTALHVFLNQFWNWQTLHGPSALTIAKQKVGIQTIEAVLHTARKGFSHYTPPTLKPFNARSREIFSLSGTLVGGNLCILQCSVGTDWQLNLSDKILFLEDVDERGYGVDRMLAHLQQANMFDDAKAIIFGDFVGGNEPDGASLVPSVIQRFAENIPLPVFSLPGCGHGDENFPLPFNIQLKFDVEANRKLKILT
ncbi:MAG: LD-carboxypeptidase [Alphaproteobacteria bacterium]|nr:LD-carboxypeptidase [Alphaproteobacteria bacterium]